MQKKGYAEAVSLKIDDNTIFKDVESIETLIIDKLLEQGLDLLNPLDYQEELQLVDKLTGSCLKTLLITNDLPVYIESYDYFYESLTYLNHILENRRYLCGDRVSQMDFKLVITLAYYELAYSRYLQPSKARLVDYHNLWDYCRDLYQFEALFDCLHFKDFAASYPIDKQDKDYWISSYYDIVVRETDWRTIWERPAKREYLSLNAYKKFRLRN